MQPKHKQQLQALLKGRKRAEKILAARRDAERQRLEKSQRLAANQALMRQYTHELEAWSQQSGILALAQDAARRCNGKLSQKVSYFLDFGLRGSPVYRAVVNSEHGRLRASHLCLTLTWQENHHGCEVEIRVHPRGTITFHNSPLPIFPLLWRNRPDLLARQFARALAHPRMPEEPANKKTK